MYLPTPPNSESPSAIHEHVTNTTMQDFYSDSDGVASPDLTLITIAETVSLSSVSSKQVNSNTRHSKPIDVAQDSNNVPKEESLI